MPIAVPIATTKVITAGNSQAVRLPKAFRVQTREMWISKNEATGEITLKPKDEEQYQHEIDELMAAVRALPFEESFIPPRDDAWRPSPFEATFEDVSEDETPAGSPTTSGVRKRRGRGQRRSTVA